MAAPTIVGNRYHFATTADALDEHMIIEHVRWVKPDTAADDMSITNTAGDVILIAASDVDKNDQDIPMYGFSTDGVIVAFESGTVDIYLRASY